MFLSCFEAPRRFPFFFTKSYQKLDPDMRTGKKKEVARAHCWAVQCKASTTALAISTLLGLQYKAHASQSYKLSSQTY